MNKELIVNIRKITIGKDGLIYLTISHPLASNFPSLSFDIKHFKLFENKQA